MSKFRERDAEQSKFGLLRVTEDLADIRVVNEGTLEDYWRKIDFIISGSVGKFPGISRKVHPRYDLDQNQLFRCLVVLQEAPRQLSCDEIQRLTGKTGSAIMENNANKVLKRVPALARRDECPRDRVRYEITDAGRAYIRYMRAWSESVRSRDVRTAVPEG